MRYYRNFTVNYILVAVRISESGYQPKLEMQEVRIRRNSSLLGTEKGQKSRSEGVQALSIWLYLVVFI